MIGYWLKFDEFWNVLVKELSQSRRFQSLSLPTYYQAKYSGGRIHVTTHNSVWTIERSDMHESWDKALLLDESMRFQRFSYDQKSIRTLSYILALMRDFVGQNKME